MADVRLTRRYRFSASHRLNSEQLSAEENRAVYGKCNNPYGHGHDYVMDVTIRGDVNEARGRLISIDALDQFVQVVVLKSFDRRNLNVEVTEFATLPPTTEVLSQVIARRMSEAWPIAFGGSGARLEKLRIRETRNNIFEVLAPAPVEREDQLDEISESRS
ncbi:MAG TPA: 6-carboxytetrahydropterin synthase [Paludibaculum sp.]|jgi:6-pyruvoyltetrahydropterin/6-carboxytetrahydropterin synthase